MFADVPPNGVAPETVNALLREFLAALVAGEPGRAEVTVGEAIDAGLSAAAIDEAIVAPAMRAVGQMWSEGELSVAQEHLATEISFRVLALQREAFRTVARRTRAIVVLAAPEGERHVLGLNMAADLLAEGGYDVRLLGADVPTASLPDMLDRMHADILGLTSTMPGAARELRHVIDSVVRVRPELHLLVGGSNVPASLRHAHGVTVSPMLAGVVETVDAIVARARLN